MTVRVTVEPGFTLGLRALPPNRQKAAIRGLAKFREAPDLPNLFLRQLKGHADYFLIDPRRGDRIILRRIADDHYVAVDVGPHDNVLRRWDRLK